MADVYNNAFPSTATGESVPIGHRSIPRPLRDRRIYLPTLADAVDRIFSMDEINPGEKRSISRAVAAVKTANDTFASYAAAGFRYYQTRGTVDFGGIVSLGDTTVDSDGWVTPDVVPGSWPDYMPYAYYRQDRNSYPIIEYEVGRFRVSQNPPVGSATGTTLEQLMTVLPKDFRRRGSLTDNEQYYPVIDVPAGVLQSWQDYWDWARSSANPRIFGSVTGDERFQGELMLMLWPPYPDDIQLKLYYERYPAELRTHRKATDTTYISTAGSSITLVSDNAAFTEDDVGSAINLASGQTAEFAKPLSDPGLLQYQRVITKYNSAISVEVDEEVDISSPGVSYYITDIIDTMPGPMTDAFFRLCEYEMIRQSRGQSGRIANRLKEFREQLELAMSDDARYADSVDDGPYLRDYYGYGVGDVIGRPGG